VGTTNVTVRFNEDELRRLDELSQRMGVTRSDVIRSLVNNFDEVLKQEVDREGRRWFAIGFTAALESAINDPEVVLRFIRRNVDILGYPDFIIGMVKVRNRVVVLSHHDKMGSQLLNLIRSKIEEEVKKEEAEIEREEEDNEDIGGAGAYQMPVLIHRGAHQRTPRAIPETIKYKLVTSGRAASLIAKPTAAGMAGKPVARGGGGNTKPAVNTTVPEKQKSATTGILTSTNPAGSQTRDSGTWASAGDGDLDPVPAGDFIMALITHSYHKHRDKLLNLIGALGGDQLAFAH
jgi:hypothetical protein